MVLPFLVCVTPNYVRPESYIMRRQCRMLLTVKFALFPRPVLLLLGGPLFLDFQPEDILREWRQPTSVPVFFSSSNPERTLKPPLPTALPYPCSVQS